MKLSVWLPWTDGLYSFLVKPSDRTGTDAILIAFQRTNQARILEETQEMQTFTLTNRRETKDSVRFDLLVNGKPLLQQVIYMKAFRYVLKHCH